MLTIGKCGGETSFVARPYSEIAGFMIALVRHVPSLRHDGACILATFLTSHAFPHATVLDMPASITSYANYLPSELLLEILAHFETLGKLERQTTLARFSAVNR